MNREHVIFVSDDSEAGEERTSNLRIFASRLCVCYGSEENVLLVSSKLTTALTHPHCNDKEVAVG